MPDFTSIQGHFRQFLPRAGKIRLGITTRSKGGKEYPSEVSYFVLDDDLPGRELIVDAFAPTLPTGLRAPVTRILVTFHSDSIEEVFPHAFKAYTRGAGLYCRGNGVEAERMVTRVEEYQDRQTGQMVKRRVPVTDNLGRPQYAPFQGDTGRPEGSTPCPCRLLLGEKKECRAVGNLYVTVPDAAMRVYQIDTGSWHSMSTVVNQLRAYKESLGGLRGRLFWLTRVPKETRGGGKTVVHYPLSLALPDPKEIDALRARVEKLAKAYMGAFALPPGKVQTQAMLPAGEIQEVEDDIVRDSRVPVEAPATSAAPAAAKESGLKEQPDSDADVPEDDLNPEPPVDGEYGDLPDGYEGGYDEASVAESERTPAPAPVRRPSASRPTATLPPKAAPTASTAPKATTSSSEDDLGGVFG